MSSLDLLPITAHGGTAGLALEIAFLAVPLLLFAGLAWWSGRKRKLEEASAPEASED